MESSGSDSTRSDCFPSGMRVLVVDSDLGWLNNLDKMLKKCDYKVTTCNLLQEALSLLKENAEVFDIVMCDIDMPDLDVFKFLDLVAREMDLPVIMMSADGEMSNVMKGVQHGACDHLHKPIRTKEIRNIWQHVMRKRLQKGCGISETQMKGNAAEQCDPSTSSTRKRKEVDSKHHDSKERVGESTSTKKSRVVWSAALHQKFLEAVNKIGFDKVGPKKILDMMGESWLTRENVASHLQKYRLNLQRMQKENQLKEASVGIKQASNISAQNHASFTYPSLINQNSILIQPNMVANVNGQQMIPENVCSSISNPVSRMSFNQSFRPFDQEVLPVQFKQEFKPHLQTEHHPFEHRPLPSCSIQVDSASSNFSHSREADIKPSYYNNAFYVQPQSPLTNCNVLKPSPPILSRKNQLLEQNPYDKVEFSMRNLAVGPGPSCDEQSNGYSYPYDLFLINDQTNLVLDTLSCANQELIDDVSPVDYDSQYNKQTGDLENGLFIS